MKGLADALTWIRIASVPAVIYFSFENSIIDHYAISVFTASLLFTFASLTDYYDGYVARNWGAISKRGEFLDPLADKILTLSIYAMFLYISMIYIPPFLVILIAIREVVVTGFRFRALAVGRKMKTERHGKVKTVIQIASQAILFLVLFHHALLLESPSFHRFRELNGLEEINGEVLMIFQRQLGYPGWSVESLYWLPTASVALAAFFTLRSGLQYMRLNWKSLIGEERY